MNRPLRPLTTIEPGTLEWTHAWAGLRAFDPDHDTSAECPDTGEVWQYMGTVYVGDRWFHEFRHRHHPRYESRVYHRVFASKGWDPRALGLPVHP